MWGRVLAFTHRASEEEQQRASKWLEFVGHPSELYNIPQTRIEDKIQDWDVVISFGTLPSVAIKQAFEKLNLNPYRLVQLPGLKQLEDRAENKGHRQQTHQSLLDLKALIENENFYPRDIVVTKDSLPALEMYQLTSLHQLAEDHGNRLLVLSVEGKQVQIGGDELVEGTDIHLSYVELLSIKQAMEIFKVEEIKLVSKEKENGR